MSTQAIAGSASKDAPEFAVSETEMRLISWLRYQSGAVAYLEALTQTQRQALEAFVRTMRESATLH